MNIEELSESDNIMMQFVLLQRYYNSEEFKATVVENLKFRRR